MDTNTNKTIVRMLEVAAALVMISAGLNLFVMQTLGSFDAAAVILALFVGFWAFVLGTVRLVGIHLAGQRPRSEAAVRIVQDCTDQPPALRPGCTDHRNDFFVAHGKLLSSFIQSSLTNPQRTARFRILLVTFSTCTAGLDEPGRRQTTK